MAPIGFPMLLEMNSGEERQNPTEITSVSFSLSAPLETIV